MSEYESPVPRSFVPAALLITYPALESRIYRGGEEDNLLEHSD